MNGRRNTPVFGWALLKVTYSELSTCSFQSHCHALTPRYTNAVIYVNNSQLQYTLLCGMYYLATQRTVQCHLCTCLLSTCFISYRLVTYTVAKQTSGLYFPLPSHAIHPNWICIRMSQTSTCHFTFWHRPNIVYYTLIDAYTTRKYWGKKGPTCTCALKLSITAFLKFLFLLLNLLHSGLAELPHLTWLQSYLLAIHGAHSHRSTTAVTLSQPLSYVTETPFLTHKTLGGSKPL